MKTRNDPAMMILTSVICLLPIILSLVLYNDLPEHIAVHWNGAGNPDNFVPKAVAAYGLPVLFLAINLFMQVFLYSDPKRSNSSQAMRILTAWVSPFLSLVLVPVTLFIAMGADISITTITPVFVGIFLVICGNYLPKNRQNYTIGIKLPWTLHNADNWNRTHRMAGYLYMIGGIGLIAGTFLLGVGALWGFSLTIGVVVLLTIIPVLYSYLLYRKTGDDMDKEGT